METSIGHKAQTPDTKMQTVITDQTNQSIPAENIFTAHPRTTLVVALDFILEKGLQRANIATTLQLSQIASRGAHFSHS